MGLLALVGLALLPAQAAAATAKPTNWKVTAGVQSPDAGIQGNAFFPHDIGVRVGDTITWNVPTGEFHTVTFLSGATAPPLIAIGPNGPDFNPEAAAPAGGSSYSGAGFFNSGVLAQDQSYTLGFAAIGNFPYVCLVHSDMKGVVHVASVGAPVQPQAIDTARGKAQAGQLLGQGGALLGQGLLASTLSGRDAVTAGIGKLLPAEDATLAVLRFLPRTRVVRAGETVTWSNLDPETPHTVTFGTEPAGGPFATFAPSDNVVAGHATITAPGQSVNSGFIGADLPFGTHFKVTFTTPGTYSYFCALHDTLGMVGTIQVVR